MPKALRRFLRKVLPTPVDEVVRLVRLRDIPVVLKFARDNSFNASVAQRMRMVGQIYKTSYRVNCSHTQAEVLSYISTILSLAKTTEGVLVEAGCFKGGSTAKFSLAADLAGRELVVFDSFCGIPANEEPHENTIFGGKASFPAGCYSGALDEVKANVAKFGKLDRCRFIQGWFEETMPHFHEPIAAAYIDVDLVSSTKTCLKYLFPLLQPGGVLFSQDAHLPLIIDVFSDDNFWENEVGCKKPHMIGLGTSKLLKVIKDPADSPLVEQTAQERPSTLSSHVY